jgi:LuxR family transcriptional regulator of csgAB operon
MLEGKTNLDIKKALFISANTVRNHIYNIYRKLGVRNRVQIINLIQTTLGNDDNS